MKKAQDILEKVKEMKSGVIGNARISVQSSIDTAVSSVSSQLLICFTVIIQSRYNNPTGFQLRDQNPQRHYISPPPVNGKDFKKLADALQNQSWFMKIRCTYQVVSVLLQKNDTKLWVWLTVHHFHFRKWTLHLGDTLRQLLAPSFFPLLCTSLSDSTNTGADDTHGRRWSDFRARQFPASCRTSIFPSKNICWLAKTAWT